MGALTPIRLVKLSRIRSLGLKWGRRMLDYVYKLSVSRSWVY